MSVGDTVTRTCKECGDDFPHTVKGQGRYPDFCHRHGATRQLAAVHRYRQTEKYRKSRARALAKKRETYDPWLWENTILEWNE